MLSIDLQVVKGDVNLNSVEGKAGSRKDLVLYAIFSMLISDLICAECLDLLPFNLKHSTSTHKSLTVAFCPPARLHRGVLVIKHFWLEHVSLTIELATAALCGEWESHGRVLERLLNLSPTEIKCRITATSFLGSISWTEGSFCSATGAITF